MNIKIFLVLLIILSLFSCAEDDQIRMGVMDFKVEVSMVTPTSATITATIPKYEDNKLEGNWNTEIKLSDKPLNSSKNFWDEGFFEYKVKEVSKDIQNNVYQFVAYDLNPNTTYYVWINTLMNNMGYYGWHDNVYYTNESFTTAKKGDYSVLGEIECELVQRDSNKAYVKVTLPPALEFSNYGYSYLERSTNPDMSNSFMTAIGNPKGNEVVVCFNDIPNGIYYLQLYGHLKFSDGSYLSDGYITLKAKTTLDLIQ